MSGTGTVNLGWNASKGATSYNVWRSIPQLPLWVLIGPGMTSTYYNDTGLINGQTYVYEVMAVNAEGPGQPSNKVSEVPVGVPGNLQATPGNASISLTWGAAAGATSYYVYSGNSISAISANIPIAVVNAPTTSYTDTGLTNGQSYTFYLVAHNATGVGSPSKSVSAMPFGQTSLEITSGPTVSLATISVVIKWTTSEAANSVVYYGFGDTTLLARVSNSSLDTKHIMTLTGLAKNATYKYWVSSTVGSVTVTSAASTFITL